ncbi:MAG: Fe-S cluster assembly protein SufD, partial [Pseudomonadota bacterium]
MSAALKLTAGEEALVASYGEKLGELPGNADTINARDVAIQMLKQSGLPTRKVEAWHYTDLRRLLSAIPADAPAPMAEIEAILPGSEILSVENGEAARVDEIDGLHAENIADALRADVGAYVPEFDGSDDAIGFINAAFVSDGYRLTVPDEAKVETPIEIQTRTGSAQAHAAHVVTIGSKANATFIDRSVSGDATMTSAVTKVSVKAGAEVNWIVVQEQGANASHLGKLMFDIAE